MILKIGKKVKQRREIKLIFFVHLQYRSPQGAYEHQRKAHSVDWLMRTPENAKHEDSVQYNNGEAKDGYYGGKLYVATAADDL